MPTFSFQQILRKVSKNLFACRPHAPLSFVSTGCAMSARVKSTKVKEFCGVY